MNNYQQITKTLFSLCKNNNGNFKSQKQKDFILSVTNGNWKDSIVYGRYVDHFDFVIDHDGVVNVIKTSSTKESVFFSRMCKRNNKIQHRINQIHLMFESVKDNIMSKIMDTTVELDFKTIERHRKFFII